VTLAREHVNVRIHPAVLVSFLALVTVAEIAVTYVNPVLVFPLDGGLIALIVAYVVGVRREATGSPEARQLLAVAMALSLAPLIRIISLTLPLAELDASLRFVAAGMPMIVGGFLAASAAGLKPREIGLRWARTGWQLEAILVSIGIGFAESRILRADALGAFPWTTEGLLPALAAGTFTGFPEELIFRGLMQTVLRPILGRWNWIYVSGIFAVLHIGYQSYIDVVFVFGVGLFYGWITERTGSIIGPAIGHGVANIVLLFVAPNMEDLGTLGGVGLEGQLLIGAVSTIGLVLAGLLFWWSKAEIHGARDEA
jgi:hypothetical protein